MNGKKAKRLRRLAAALAKRQAQASAHLDDSDYIQQKNCRAMVPDPDYRDGDGKPLLKPVLNPGTIRHAHPFMRIYRTLKAVSKKVKRGEKQ